MADYLIGDDSGLLGGLGFGGLLLQRGLVSTYAMMYASFQKNRGSSVGTRVVGLLLQGHSQKRFFKIRGPQNRPQHTLILSIGAPNKGPHI